MNRIILIGNGFDLAHGLPTRYEDFINWYWERRLVEFALNYSKIDTLDILCTFKILAENAMTWSDVFNHWKYKCGAQNGAQFMKEAIIADKENFQIECSPFFGNICKSIETKEWVDIENEYYHMLCFCMNDTQMDVAALNKEFHVLKSLLVEYLQSIGENECLLEKIKIKMMEPLRAREIALEAKEIWMDFIAKRVDDYSKYSLYQSPYFSEKTKQASGQIADFYDKHLAAAEYAGFHNVNDKIPAALLFPNRIMLLNFNYTSVADAYMPSEKSFIVNHIHGRLNEANSDIIFGYGDELDKNYKLIEESTDNSYLENIKSIHYHMASNYRNMLEFAESNYFQIVIMGHSCGNSDRTLLNTLFEHKNCVSIKPFYYQKEDGTDNYEDIVRNISRNFTNKQLMRDRVVNKTFCGPLPQSKAISKS